MAGEWRTGSEVVGLGGRDGSGCWVGWLYSGSRSFEAKFPPASISLKTEGCRAVQVLISRVSYPVPNMVIYVYQKLGKLPSRTE